MKRLIGRRLVLILGLGLINMSFLVGPVRGAEKDKRGVCSSCVDEYGKWYNCCPDMCSGSACNCTLDTDCSR